MKFRIAFLSALVCILGTIVLGNAGSFSLTFAQSNAQSPPAAPAPSPKAPPNATSNPPASSAPAKSETTPPQPAAPQSASTVPEQASSTPVTPVAMAPADAQALLYKIYVANFRIGDLTSALQPGSWKLSAQDRAAFAERADALQAAVAAVKKTRDDFYGNPADADLGRATVAAIQALLPQIGDFINALKSSPGAASAKDYEQASADLSELEGKLAPYVAYLEAKEHPPGNAGGALQTEEVRTATPAAPIASTSTEKAPLNHEELKALLYQAYAPAFRIKDLLAQERPDTWKASDADRSAFRSASEELSQKLAELEKWRAELEGRPDSLEAAFEVYAALGDLIQPAGAVGRLATEFDSPPQGAEYGEKAQQVAGLRGQVEPYLGYLLRRSDQQAGTVEHNFDACEKELSYSMRPSTPVAEPMKNVLPVFKGRGRSVARGRGRQSTAHSHEKKASKTATSKPTGR